MAQQLSDRELSAINEDDAELKIPAESSWLSLKTGDKVIVNGSQDWNVPGLVDEIADDRSVLWIHLGEGRGRRLFHWREAATVERRN